MQLTSSGKVFFRKALSVSEIAALEKSKRDEFYIQLLRSNGAAHVTLQYTQPISDGLLSSGGSCVEQVIDRVVATKGQRPVVKFVNNTNTSEVRFAAPRSCVLTVPLAGSVAVSGFGSRFVARTDDVCSGVWKRRGQISGVSVAQSLTTAADNVVFSPSGSNRALHISVSLGGKIVKRGLLTAFHNIVPSTRVYKGTDEFQNYCVNQHQTILSYHGRLFCWQLGGLVEGVSLKSTP
jgi:hypothetical protein